MRCKVEHSEVEEDDIPVIPVVETWGFGGSVYLGS